MMIMMMEVNDDLMMIIEVNAVHDDDGGDAALDDDDDGGDAAPDDDDGGDAAPDDDEYRVFFSKTYESTKIQNFTNIYFFYFLSN